MEFYLPNEKYLDFLREYESKIMKTNYSIGKIVVGACFEINGIYYYAPLSSIKENQVKYNEKESRLRLKNSFRKGCHEIFGTHKLTGQEELLSTLRIHLMFPIPIDELIKVEIPNLEKKYKDLVMKEYLHCKINKVEIERHAIEVYKNFSTKSLVGICCNFILLEEKYKEWKNKKLGI